MTILIEFDEQHVEQTFLWMQNDELKKMFLLDKEVSRHSHLSWFTALKSDKSQEVFAILYNNVHVGNIGVKNIDIRNKKAEAWIYLGNIEFRGKGIAKESLHELSILKKGTLQKLYAQIASFNFNSMKTFLSSGYLIEGVLPMEMVFKEKSIDIYRLYKIL